MLEKLKANRSKIISHFITFVLGIILVGGISAFCDEQLNYSCLVIYAYAVFGHRKIAKIVEDKVI